ncbi:MAG: hypothetical protein KJO69_10405 [Gammaproteobacteria bacterium]|nr:hypothetical protein [Gammaproteobacteria bacterium]NNJ72035.1 hypothetical protein [Enterobacterales bacterium]
MFYLLEYDYVPDIIERRDTFRADHLAQAQKLFEQQKLHMAGASGDPVNGALFIFKNVDEIEIREFVAADPYVLNSLVTDWRIIPWSVVIGE